MAKKTYAGLLMVAFSFMLGACSTSSEFTQGNKVDERNYNRMYERTHERKTPLVSQVDRY